MLRAIAERVLRATPAVSVVYELTPGVTALADAAKLERAVENLVDNARKFTPAGGAIHLRTRTLPDSATPATLEVANTCDEVAPEELAQLFERFYRRDRARSARVPGTGLGLAIARDLVRLQHGALAAASDDGLLTFTLCAPRTPD